MEHSTRFRPWYLSKQWHRNSSRHARLSRSKQHDNGTTTVDSVYEIGYTLRAVVLHRTAARRPLQKTCSTVPNLRSTSTSSSSTRPDPDGPLAAVSRMTLSPTPTLDGVSLVTASRLRCSSSMVSDPSAPLKPPSLLPAGSHRICTARLPQSSKIPSRIGM